MADFAGMPTVDTDTIFDLAIASEGEGSTVLFAARNSGVYRSRDVGAAWDRLLGSADIPIATAIAVSPNFVNDNRVLAGTSGGIFRSVDWGDTWQFLSFGLPPPFVTTISFSDSIAQDSTAIAGTMNDGVYRSADGGMTWNPANVGVFDMSITASSFCSGRNVASLAVIGTESGLFRSENGGQSWRDVDLPDPEAIVTCITGASAESGDQMLVVGTENHGLYQSLDRGRSWTDLAEPGSFGPIIAVRVLVGDKREFAVTVVSSDIVSDWRITSGTGDLVGEFALSNDSPVTAVAFGPAGADVQLVAGFMDGTIRTVMKDQ